ncbi:LysR family transcriptional regulator [Jiulongibacter sediminis]|uniref:LysR family transcriptional regulator n=1 Tax=Jiulongibacter sediminis TaxID=1605367 RepID=A0A0P7BS89_9BACT|nr:LysR substrate-binding domain-containing protein [Jiulongibacter sediminis]KPM47814.1 LysR family transcriptional regulator [Jiulongibacter sediminis]TBX23998.1 LysR family transcriptional regulator [Jiulongibacter sediminis]
MNYTFHQLQIFLKVVEHESITKAAEELYMTQPAVSIQLKNFQNQFDLALTEVIGRQLFITEFGKEVAVIAERVVQEMENINMKTQSFKGHLTGRIKISSASTGKYVIPYFIGGFFEQHRSLDLILDVTNKTRVVESLKQNEIDFALISVLPENIEVEEEILIENRLLMVGNKPHRDESRPLIYREEGSATRSAMEEYFNTKEKNQRKRLELTSNEAVKQAVLAGIGNSIMPVIGMHNELQNGDLHVLNYPRLPITTQWRLVWLKGKKLLPASQALLDYIRNEKENIIEEHFKWYQNYG